MSTGLPEPVENEGVPKSVAFAKIDPKLSLAVIMHEITSPIRMEVVPVTEPTHDSLELVVGMPSNINVSGLKVSEPPVVSREKI